MTGDDDSPVADVLELAGLVLALVILVAALATTAYAVSYEFTDKATVETADTSGVIGTADAPAGRSFIVAFDGPIQEGGPTEVTVIGPDGEIQYRTVLVPGVERVTLPEDEIQFPGIEYESGEYEVVATHANEVHGRATVTIGSKPVLPYVPLDMLFGYGLGFGVLAVAAVVGGVGRGD